MIKDDMIMGKDQKKILVKNGGFVQFYVELLLGVSEK